MKQSSGWSRREFVKMAGCSCVGAMTLGMPDIKRSDAPAFAYVGLGRGGENREGIAVFDAGLTPWRQTSIVSSPAPVWLAMDPNERFLYAVNGILEYEGLPAGTVEAYAIDGLNGSLRLLNRQRLSLSATSPKHAAVSPDGRTLVVAVDGGGAYNALPIREDGSLGQVSGILKETGAGPHAKQGSAHPQMVVFDSAGRVVSADLGNDRLNVIKVNATKLSVSERYRVQPGDGPHQIALHPNGQLLFVANGLDESLACYGYDSVRGRITGCLHEVRTKRGDGGQGVVMAIDSAGGYLFTAHRSGGNGISAWKIAQNGGPLELVQAKETERMQFSEMATTREGGRLLALSSSREGVFGWNVTGGRLGSMQRLASLKAPISMAVKSLVSGT